MNFNEILSNLTEKNTDLTEGRKAFVEDVFADEADTRGDKLREIVAKPENEDGRINAIIVETLVVAKMVEPDFEPEPEETPESEEDGNNVDNHDAVLEGLGEGEEEDEFVLSSDDDDDDSDVILVPNTSATGDNPVNPTASAKGEASVTGDANSEASANGEAKATGNANSTASATGNANASAAPASATVTVNAAPASASSPTPTVTVNAAAPASAAPASAAPASAAPASAAPASAAPASAASSVLTDTNWWKVATGVLAALFLIISTYEMTRHDYRADAEMAKQELSEQKEAMVKAKAEWETAKAKLVEQNNAEMQRSKELADELILVRSEVVALERKLVAAEAPIKDTQIVRELVEARKQDAQTIYQLRDGWREVSPTVNELVLLIRENNESMNPGKIVFPEELTSKIKRSNILAGELNAKFATK